RDRHQPRGEENPRGDEGARHRRPGPYPRRRRHRSRDLAEISQLLVLELARPVRLGDLVQLGGQLRERHEGPAGRDHLRGSRAARGELHAADAARQRDRADAERAERGDARVVSQGLRDRPEALEPHDRARRARVPAVAALLALSPADRPVGRAAGRSTGQAHRAAGIRAPPRGLDPGQGRPRFRAFADATGHRTGQEGRLDRASRARHQQPGGRLRVRATELMSLRAAILGFLVIVVAAAAAGAWWLYASRDALVKRAIERYGPQVTGVSVKVKDVKIEPLDGSGAISGLELGNPKGFSAPHSLTLGEVRLAVDP